MLCIACQSETPMVNLGIDEEYAVERMKALVLHPEFNGEQYIWSMPDRAATTRWFRPNVISYSARRQRANTGYDCKS